MSPLSFFTLPFLCTFSLFSTAFSIQCSEKQYAWPFANPQHCCDKCSPGYYMTRDPDTSCHNECKPCEKGRYMETYNVKTFCYFCECKKQNTEVMVNCTSTRNAVCGCKAGYHCNNRECAMCVKTPTTKPTLPRPTTGVMLSPETIGKDKTVWFLVITGLLSAVIVLVVATKIKPLLHWAKFSQDTAPKKPAAGAVQPLSQEDRDVSKPVQEVCRECDQLTDLCMKV